VRRLRNPSSRRRARSAVVVCATSWVALSVGIVTATAGAGANTGAGATSTTVPEPSFVAEIKPGLEAIMAKQQVPGAIVLVDIPNRGTWQGALGVGNLTTNTPISVADHVRIGSITKTMTATVALQLVDEGKLHLDDPVAKYVTGVPSGANITIRDLLDMNSGLPNTTESDALNDEIDAHPSRAWTVEEVLRYGLDSSLSDPPQQEHAPGQGFYYSNTNYELLGLIATKITGHSLQQLFRDRIFRPLGMRQSLLPAATDTSLPKPYAHGYIYGTNQENNQAYKALFGPDAATKGIIPAGPEVQPTDATRWNPSYIAADGGAISTAGDLLVWARALATGSLLGHATQQERVTSPCCYGLGIEQAFDGRLLGHNGAIPGYQSFMGYDPQTGAVIIVLANLMVAKNTYLLDGLPADTMAKYILDTLLPAKTPAS
jgi:D-alanyl-D-alanine carboxypeptidase